MLYEGSKEKACTNLKQSEDLDFGSGSGHPAQLNFRDCFACALAKSTREPLLFKGDDFPRGLMPAA